MEEQKKQAAEPVAPCVYDAFVSQIPRLTREQVDHPGDTGRPDWRALDGDEALLGRCIAAALRAAPAIQQPQDERAAFEAWALDDNGGHWTFESAMFKREDGEYVVPGVRNEWVAWQARASLAKKGGA